MDSFKKFFTEKADIKVKGGWSVVVLDDGTELSASMELLAKGNIQIHPANGKSKTIHVGENPVKYIEDELGYKLPIGDKELEMFISLLPCPCEN